MQHGLEGSGEIVGQLTAVVVFRRWHQADQNQEHKEEQVEVEGGAEHPLEEVLLWGGVLPPLMLPMNDKLTVRVVGISKQLLSFYC